MTVVFATPNAPMDALDVVGLGIVPDSVNTRPSESSGILDEKIASLIDYIGTLTTHPVHQTFQTFQTLHAEASTEHQRVLAAILPDGTTVRLGEATHDAVRGCYRMVNGDLELHPSECAEDGTYCLDSGVYAVVTESEFESMKRNERATSAVTQTRATTTASADAPRVETQERVTLVPDASIPSVSSVPPVPAALPVPALPAPPPAFTEEVAGSRPTTVVAVGPAHVNEGLQKASALLSAAGARGNRTLVVVLGVNTDADADAARAITHTCVRLAGLHELRAFSRGASLSESMRAYLRVSVLSDCIAAGNGCDVGADGARGVWVAACGAEAVADRMVPASNAMSKVARKDAVNERWRVWIERACELIPDANDTNDTNDAAAQVCEMVALAQSQPEQHARAVLSGKRRAPWTALATHEHTWSCSAVATADGERERVHTLAMPTQTRCAAFAHESALFWCVASWCPRTQEMLRPAIDLPDPDAALADPLPLDTLASLAAYADATTDAALVPDVALLRGTLGPVVLAGIDDAEVLRFVWWRVGTVDDDDDDETADDDVVGMLLSEAYVRATLPDVVSVAPTSAGRPTLASAGYVVLADDDVVPMRFVHRTQVEHAEVARELGYRMWRVRRRRDGAPSMASMALMARVLGATPPLDLVRATVGHRAARVGNASVFYLTSSSEDALSGLQVVWRRPADAHGVAVLDLA